MADTCYLEILATQRPFPVQVDENERTMFAVNFTALSDGDVLDWERDVIRLLISGGVTITYTFPDGDRKTDNTFVGPASVMPTRADSFITIIDTGGAAPIETHNDDIQEQLSVQILVRGNQYYDARDLALDCWRALDGVRNTTVTS